MASGSFAHPNVMLYFLLCRGTQIEVDPRICSSRSHGDGGHYFTGCCKAQFIDPSRQRSRVLPLRVRAPDDQRRLSPFSLKANYSIFEGVPIRSHDIPLDQRSLRRERRREKERTHQKKSGNKAVPKHRLILGQSRKRANGPQSSRTISGNRAVADGGTGSMKRSSLQAISKSGDYSRIAAALQKSRKIRVCNKPTESVVLSQTPRSFSSDLSHLMARRVVTLFHRRRSVRTH